MALRKKVKKIIRIIEKSLYKINAAELAIIFNNTCIKKGILPKYTNLRLHDLTARETPATAEFRRTLIWRRLEEKQQELLRLREEHVTLRARWAALQDLDERKDIEATLERLTEDDYNRKAATSQRKLVRCNGGLLRISRRKEPTHINLTDYHSSPDEEELLQLGLNCHVIEKPSTLDKMIEIESL